MSSRSAARVTPTRGPAAPDALKGCTHLKVRQAGRCLSQHYDAYTAAAGLKTTQYSLISAVMRLEPVQPAALAASLNLDASTLTRNLRPLIDHGWIEVLPGPDARSRRIVSTPAGRAIRLEAKRYWTDAQQALNDRLGLKKVIELHALLDHVLAEFAVAEAAQPAATRNPAANARSSTPAKRRKRRQP